MLRKLLPIALGFLLVFLPACGNHPIPPSDKETLVLAIFEDNARVSEQVTLFNENNDDYNIVVKRYIRTPHEIESDGIATLQREIMSGKGPDIIDYGSLYNAGDIAGGYTEDLLDWFDSTADFAAEDFYANIMESYKYQGALYAMPVSFRLKTLVGTQDNLGSVNHWTVEGMMACYEQYADDKILYPGETKLDVLGRILSGSMGYYIDWETGICRFDSEEFKQVMMFSDRFPAHFMPDDDFSAKRIFLDDGALLYPLILSNIYDIRRSEIIFGDADIAYIGFPVTGINGTMIMSYGPMLSISIGSSHKEAAWAFIRQFLGDEYQDGIDDELPIRRDALEKMLLDSRDVEYDGAGEIIARSVVMFEGEDDAYIYHLPEQQADALRDLIENAELNASVDYKLYQLLMEEAAGYLMGNKSLEETVDVMQGRASIYVNEKIK